MKQTRQVMPLATALLWAFQVNAQSTTSTSSNNGAVTSYFSVCPTAGATTVTLSTTTTICPGPNCGGTTTVYNPSLVTSVGADGKTTVYEELYYTAPCPCDGGVCDAVYTVTRGCPCTALPEPTVVPSGFATSEMACHVCAENGGPQTVTVVTPAANGPYATQTPVMGTPYNGASASAGANAYASAGPEGAVASAGASAVASADNGSASANAGSNAGASNDNSAAVASSGSSASANAGNEYVPPSATGMSTARMNSTGTSPSVATYTGAADRMAGGVSAFVVCIFGLVAISL